MIEAGLDKFAFEEASLKSSAPPSPTHPLLHPPLLVFSISVSHCRSSALLFVSGYRQVPLTIIIMCCISVCLFTCLMSCVQMSNCMCVCVCVCVFVPTLTCYGAWWTPGPVWTGGKSRPHRDSIPDRPARNQLLYRLNYPAHGQIVLGRSNDGRE